MSELNELYQRVILEHNRHPHHFRKLENANRSAEGYNPVCGDQILVFVRLEDSRISDIGFQGSGCAISIASASLMTESVKGKNAVEAQKILEAVERMLASESEPEGLGELNALAGVRQFPVRIKCATLGWHTLIAALREQTRIEL